jgi:hypothetical protein
MARRYARVVASLIKSKGVVRFAEIGTYASAFAVGVLNDAGCRGMIKEYWAVDPFALYPNNPLTQSDWDTLYMRSCLLGTVRPQHRTIRATSIEAAKLFSAEYFDMVFIDADHSYDAVKTDIAAWLPKIRKGGFISGHDYGHRYTGVKRAVHAAFGQAVINCGASVWGHQV